MQKKCNLISLVERDFQDRKRINLFGRIATMSSLASRKTAGYGGYLSGCTLLSRPDTPGKPQVAYNLRDIHVQMAMVDID